ncbi:serine protease inhibitor Kazal-type 1-like [Ruditapes philippinarum]|uniref:serine protease inhibitor Kazal-type 1-like n=1 Tax=Ruditapes philippinarum TaxID=129788 RepID=UPI00295C2171|nr:serine protease inhibitor Kazal-type 1-like [Ruditapes philippinarum]
MFGIKSLPLLILFAVYCYGIPIPPDQLLAWLVPEMCPQNDCPTIELSVCGTDGQTYKNECFLKVSNCSSNDVLMVKYFGSC